MPYDIATGKYTEEKKPWWKRGLQWLGAVPGEVAETARELFEPIRGIPETAAAQRRGELWPSPTGAEMDEFSAELKARPPAPSAFRARKPEETPSQYWAESRLLEPIRAQWDWFKEQRADYQAKETERIRRGDPKVRTGAFGLGRLEYPGGKPPSEQVVQMIQTPPAQRFLQAPMALPGEIAKHMRPGAQPWTWGRTLGEKFAPDVFAPTEPEINVVATEELRSRFPTLFGGYWGGHAAGALGLGAYVATDPYIVGSVGWGIGETVTARIARIGVKPSMATALRGVEGVAIGEIPVGVAGRADLIQGLTKRTVAALRSNPELYDAMGLVAGKATPRAAFREVLERGVKEILPRLPKATRKAIGNRGLAALQNEWAPRLRYFGYRVPWGAGRRPVYPYLGPERVVRAARATTPSHEVVPGAYAAAAGAAETAAARAVYEAHPPPAIIRTVKELGAEKVRTAVDVLFDKFVEPELRRMGRTGAAGRRAARPVDSEVFARSAATYVHPERLVLTRQLAEAQRELTRVSNWRVPAARAVVSPVTTGLEALLEPLAALAAESPPAPPAAEAPAARPVAFRGVQYDLSGKPIVVPGKAPKVRQLSLEEQMAMGVPVAEEETGRMFDVERDVAAAEPPDVSEVVSGIIATLGAPIEELPKPPAATRPVEELTTSPEYIWRGTTAREIESIKRTGFIRTRSEIVARDQVGITSFSRNPAIAAAFAGRRAAVGETGYLLKVKLRPELIDNVYDITGEEEVNFRQPLPAEDIVAVYPIYETGRQKVEWTDDVVPRYGFARSVPLSQVGPPEVAPTPPPLPPPAIPEDLQELRRLVQALNTEVASLRKPLIARRRYLLQREAEVVSKQAKAKLRTERLALSRALYAERMGKSERLSPEAKAEREQARARDKQARESGGGRGFSLEGTHWTSKYLAIKDYIRLESEPWYHPAGVSEAVWLRDVEALPTIMAEIGALEPGGDQYDVYVTLQEAERDRWLQEQMPLQETQHRLSELEDERAAAQEEYDRTLEAALAEAEAQGSEPSDLSYIESELAGRYASDIELLNEDVREAQAAIDEAEAVVTAAAAPQVPKRKAVSAMSRSELLRHHQKLTRWRSTAVPALQNLPENAQPDNWPEILQAIGEAPAVTPERTPEEKLGSVRHILAQVGVTPGPEFDADVRNILMQRARSRVASLEDAISRLESADLAAETAEAVTSALQEAAMREGAGRTAAEMLREPAKTAAKWAKARWNQFPDLPVEQQLHLRNGMRNIQGYYGLLQDDMERNLRPFDSQTRAAMYVVANAGSHALIEGLSTMPRGAVVGLPSQAGQLELLIGIATGKKASDITAYVDPTGAFVLRNKLPKAYTVAGKTYNLLDMWDSMLRSRDIYERIYKGGEGYISLQETINQLRDYRGDPERVGYIQDYMPKYAFSAEEAEAAINAADASLRPQMRQALQGVLTEHAKYAASMDRFIKAAFITAGVERTVPLQPPLVEEAEPQLRLWNETGALREDFARLLPAMDAMLQNLSYFGQVRKALNDLHLYEYIREFYPTIAEIDAERGEGTAQQLVALGYKPFEIAGAPAAGLEDRLLPPHVQGIVQGMYISGSLMPRAGEVAAWARSWLRPWQIALLSTLSFIQAQAVEQVFNLAVAGVFPQHPIAAVRATAYVAKVFAQTAVEDFSRVPPRALAEKLRHKTARLIDDFALKATGREELARQYAKEFRDLGVSTSGLGPAKRRLVEEFMEMFKVPTGEFKSFVGLMSQLIMSADDIGRSIQYIGRRMLGDSPDRARLSVQEWTVEYGLDSGAPIDRIFQHFMFFYKWFRQRVPMFARLAKEKPIYAVLTEELIRNHRQLEGFDAEQDFILWAGRIWWQRTALDWFDWRFNQWPASLVQGAPPADGVMVAANGYYKLSMRPRNPLAEVAADVTALIPGIGQPAEQLLQRIPPPLGFLRELGVTGEILPSLEGLPGISAYTRVAQKRAPGQRLAPVPVIGKLAKLLGAYATTDEVVDQGLTPKAMRAPNWMKDPFDKRTKAIAAKVKLAPKNVWRQYEIEFINMTAELEKLRALGFSYYVEPWEACLSRMIESELKKELRFIEAAQKAGRLSTFTKAQVLEEVQLRKEGKGPQSWLQKYSGRSQF